MDDKDLSGSEVSFHAGFPNAAEGAARQALSLDALVVQRPASTFFWKLSDDIPEAHWLRGDILAVDKSVPPKLNDWVVVIIDSDFVLCRYQSARQLRRASGEIVKEEASLWGVVTYAIQPARGRA